MYILIVNPVAGNGRAKKIYKRIERLDFFQREKCATYFTSYPWHVLEIVEQVEKKVASGAFIQAIIVIGGDGTMHEVVNGLNNTSIPIAYIPGGSGNDFARGVGISKNPEKVLTAILDDTALTYWLGTFKTKEEQKQKFVNCIGFGFDAVVVDFARRVPFRTILNKLRLGTLIYLFAMFRALISYKPRRITLELDGTRHTFERAFFITVNNHPYFGGGMKINPLAKNNREHLSIIVVDSISKWKILALFGTVFIGKHLSFQGVHTFFSKQITVSADTPLPYEVDGEYGETNYAQMENNAHSIQVKGKTK